MAQKIILIDDSQSTREQLSAVLTAAGYVTIEAEDGVEGARLIRANPNAALAICDLHMPKLSGLELLEMLHGESTVPFLMLTTEGRVDLLEKARGFGAKGWMVKPFKPAMLLAAVRKLGRMGSTERPM
ncbi:MAG: response regulator [Myxococcota bacterium]|nr:response regulator [Myxococcota bacterium]